MRFGGQKIVWVWDRIRESKENGGLGVRDLRAFKRFRGSKIV